MELSAAAPPGASTDGSLSENSRFPPLTRSQRSGVANGVLLRVVQQVVPHSLAMMERQHRVTQLFSESSMPGLVSPKRPSSPYSHSSERHRSNEFGDVIAVQPPRWSAMNESRSRYSRSAASRLAFTFIHLSPFSAQFGFAAIVLAACMLLPALPAQAEDSTSVAPQAIHGNASTAGPAVARPRLLAVRGGGNRSTSPDRMAEAKTLIDAYHNQCVRYVDALVRKENKPESIEASPTAPQGAVSVTPQGAASVTITYPNPGTSALMLGRLVADDPKDAAAFEALTFLTKYVGVAGIEEALANVPGKSTDDAPVKIDPLAVLLEHHANNPQLADITDRLPSNPAVDAFLAELFAKTMSPEVRGRVGFRLVTTALKNEDQAAAESLLTAIAQDKYMAGVRVNSRGRSAQEWAEGKLRELNLLNVGQPLPEVAGETPEGKKSSIVDYRGKVVVVDVWTTWCSPCRAMIPHEREMMQRLAGEPFALLSVSCDEEKQALTDFLAENPMPWNHWWVGTESEFGRLLNITSYPTIFVLDAKGIVRFKNLRGEKLEEAVRSLLAEER